MHALQIKKLSLSPELPSNRLASSFKLKRGQTTPIFTTVINIFQKRSIFRLKSELDLIYDMVKDRKFFKNLEEKHGTDIVYQILNAMTFEKIKANSLVFEKGTIGTKFYIVLKGKVAILIDRQANQPESPSSEKTIKKRKESKLKGKLLNNETPTSEPDLQKNPANKKKSIFISNDKPAEGKDNQKRQKNEIFITYVTSVSTENLEKKESLVKNISPSEKDVEKKIILGEGETFGELALIADIPRSATAVCEEDCCLAVLKKEKYREILGVSDEMEEKREFFGNVGILHGLSKLNFYNFIYNIEHKIYGRSHIVMDVNEKLDKIFFVRKGEVKIMKKIGIDAKSEDETTDDIFRNIRKRLVKAIDILTMGVGEFFGLESGFEKDKSEFTYISGLGGTEVYILNKKDFCKRVNKYINEEGFSEFVRIIENRIQLINECISNIKMYLPFKTHPQHKKKRLIPERRKSDDYSNHENKNTNEINLNNKKVFRNSDKNNQIRLEISDKLENYVNLKDKILLKLNGREKLEMIFEKEEFQNKKNVRKMKILINSKKKNNYNYLAEKNSNRERIINNLKNSLHKSNISDEGMGFSVHYHSLSYDLN